MKITHTTEIEEERIDDLLTSAFEGGSNYWYQIDNQTTPFEGFAGEAWRQPGGILIKDMENEADPGKVLDAEAVERGLQLMADKFPSRWADFITENDDAETGDVFLQLCLFGEVIYG